MFWVKALYFGASEELLRKCRLQNRQYELVQQIYSKARAEIK